MNRNDIICGLVAFGVCFLVGASGLDLLTAILIGLPLGYGASCLAEQYFTGGQEEEAPRVIEFECPACGQDLEAPPERIGRRVRCAECGARVRVPDGEHAQEQPRESTAMTLAKKYVTRENVGMAATVGKALFNWVAGRKVLK